MDEQTAYDRARAVRQAWVDSRDAPYRIVEHIARALMEVERAARAAGRAEGEKAARITIGQMSGGNVTGVHINLDD